MERQSQSLSFTILDALPRLEVRLLSTCCCAKSVSVLRLLLLLLLLRATARSCMLLLQPSLLLLLLLVAAPWDSPGSTAKTLNLKPFKNPVIKKKKRP